MLTDHDMTQVRKLFEKTGGKAWEPRCGTRPGGKAGAFLDRVIEAGYFKRVDGRCMFERFPESMLAWTEAGRAALQQQGERT